MFFRPHGRQVLLLHSFRDSLNRVRHRQLARWRSVDEFRRMVGQRGSLKTELEPRCAEWKVDWEQLQQRAELLCHKLPNPPLPSLSPKRLRAAARVLARELDHPQVLDLIGEELERIRARLQSHTQPEQPWQALIRQERARLPQQNGRFDPSSPEVRSYRDLLRQWGSQLWRQGQLPASLELHREWVRICPEAEACHRYGALLQLAGRSQEALEQYRRVPLTEATAHYHQCALQFQAGRPDLALERLLEAMRRDQRPILELERLEKGGRPQPGSYWDTYAPLWSPESRSFALKVYSLMAVKSRLLQIRQTGKRLRHLIHPRVLFLFREKLGIAGAASESANSGG